MTEPLLLIVGGESDPNTQRVVDQAHVRGVPYYFLDTDLDNSHRIAWDFESARLDLDGESIQPTAVFLRYNVFGGASSRNLAIFDTFQAYLLAWTELRMLNRSVFTDGNNKARNLRWARDVGLMIPQTLVLADLSPLETMPNPAGFIIKPLAGGANARAVSEVRNELTELSELPPQFVQNRLAGENLRLFFVGEQRFCFHLQTTQLDYREDVNVAVVSIMPPPEILTPAQRLVQRIGFDFCALDFRCVQGFAQPVFLEVNSFPMFVRFDDASENALVDAILGLLMPGWIQ